MVDHSRQLQGVLCALAECSLPCAFVLNPNAQNLKQTLNLAGVVHHSFVTRSLFVNNVFVCRIWFVPEAALWTLETTETCNPTIILLISITCPDLLGH